MLLPNYVRIDPDLGGPHLDRGHALHPILAEALSRRLGRESVENPRPLEFWSAEHFGLDRVTLFQRASEDERRRVLAACAEGLLTEAYFIERLGLSFTAKMVLLSETTEERMLYSLFAADEATHFHAIAAYLPDRYADLDPDHQFIRLLADVIREGNKPTLTYLIQVVLEGWGISHYQSMAGDCLSEGLRRTLQRIVRDEALHHGSGVALVKRQSLAEADQTYVVEVLVRLCQMVRAGPQAVVARVEQVKGHLSREQKSRVFRELNASVNTWRKLMLLRRLMQTGPSDSIIASLERYAVFRPLSPEECAGWAAG